MCLLPPACPAGLCKWTFYHLYNLLRARNGRVCKPGAHCVLKGITVQQVFITQEVLFNARNSDIDNKIYSNKIIIRKVSRKKERQKLTFSMISNFESMLLTCCCCCFNLVFQVLHKIIFSWIENFAIIWCNKPRLFFFYVKHKSRSVKKCWLFCSIQLQQRGLFKHHKMFCNSVQHCGFFHGDP